MCLYDMTLFNRQYHDENIISSSSDWKSRNDHYETKRKSLYQYSVIKIPSKIATTMLFMLSICNQPPAFFNYRLFGTAAGFFQRSHCQKLN